ncbi:uncharacterized protein LOC131292795, partial [Anopheles ziemanni]|uniref:uncharacterized protein LOC131271145 n=1 Tax=Anopheles coustani TaxID=139045 RepID=UPI002658E1D4
MRLKSQERKMEKDEFLKQWYHQTIADYVAKGYARKATVKELLEDNPKIYYLPHFATINANKVPPKPRLVFDAAAKNNGKSLNSHLLTGPDATTSLIGVLIRFREHPIGCTGDIKEMFHQIKIRHEDQYAQRFLFRGSPDMVPQVYVMQVMMFGATCSPACAQYVKNQNAELFQEKYPEAAEAIVRNHYVDDYLDSFPDLETAVRTIQEVCEIHNRANFFLRNFITNNKELESTIPADRLSENTLLDIGTNSQTSEKVLGLLWDRKSDEFRVAPKKPLSIPRLELQAAVLGTRLTEATKKELRITIDDVYYWTDSTTVLGWISSEARKFKQFTALRIGEILETTNKNQWQWVASGSNPADEATKEKKGPSLWLEGPAFLKQEIIPRKPQPFVTYEDLKPVHVIKTFKRDDFEIISIQWCSSWVRLKKALAIWLCYIKKLQHKVKREPYTQILDCEMWTTAEILLLKKAQWESFEEEVTNLTLNKPIPRHSSIRSLNPYLEDGILR